MVDRIILILKTQDLTSSQFADEIGVQRSSISHILSGRNNASLEFVTKILKRFPDLQSDWLIFGKGPMYRESNSSNIDDNFNTSLSDELDLFSLPTEEKSLHISNSVNEIKIEPFLEEIKTSPNTEEIYSQNKKEIVQESIEEEKEAVLIDNISDVKEEIKPKQIKEKSIDKIVIFYSDRTFREYYPE